MFHRKLLHASFVVAPIFAASQAAYGQNTSRTQSFSPVGLASTETAQINVVNVASNSSTGIAASCSGSISFLDASGNTIGTATSFTITSGQIFSDSLPYSSTGASSRIVIRGILQITVSTSSSTPCALQSSLEVFDTSTGVTHAILAGPGPGGTSGPGFAPPGGGR